MTAVDWILPAPARTKTCSCGRPVIAGGECTACRAKRERALRRPNSRASTPDRKAPAPGLVSGPGRPLESGPRSEMESRFNHDFSRVRVHTDPGAASAARRIGAQAFTIGSDIAFATGRYDAASIDGRRLLAHELAHVVQQHSAVIADRPAAHSQAGDGYERAADAAGAAVLVGRRVPPQPSATALMIARNPDPPAPGSSSVDARLRAILAAPVPKGGDQRRVALIKLLETLTPADRARLASALSDPKHPITIALSRRVHPSTVPRILGLLQPRSADRSSRLRTAKRHRDRDRVRYSGAPTRSSRHPDVADPDDADAPAAQGDTPKAGADTDRYPLAAGGVAAAPAARLPATSPTAPEPSNVPANENIPAPSNVPANENVPAETAETAEGAEAAEAGGLLADVLAGVVFLTILLHEDSSREAPDASRPPAPRRYPDQTCEDAVLDGLQEEVDWQCKHYPSAPESPRTQRKHTGARPATAAERGCDESMGKAQLKRNAMRNERCAAARQKVQQVCFAHGSDPGHEEALDLARRAAERCWELYRRAGG
jgi:Domain of unknown function (DUF4157)